jgi:hypothetical protein
MDYLSQQILSTAKKLREWPQSITAQLQAIRSELSNISANIQNAIHAVHEHDKTSEARDYAPGRVRAELSTPVPIRVEAETNERSGPWKTIKTGFEMLGISAAVVYTFLAYHQLQTMTDATNATQDGVAEARRNRLQAEKSLNATIKQFHLDQRAWLGIEDLRGTPEPGKPYDIVIVLRNSGKTPAKNVFSYARYSPLEKLPQRSLIKEDCDLAKPRGSRTLLSPNGIFLQTLKTTKGQPLDPKWKESIPNQTMYAHGCTLYEDIYGGQHWLNFCGYWSEEFKAYAFCTAFNDTGDGHPFQP